MNRNHIQQGNYTKLSGFRQVVLSLDYGFQIGPKEPVRLLDAVLVFPTKVKKTGLIPCYHFSSLILHSINLIKYAHTPYSVAVKGDPFVLH